MTFTFQAVILHVYPRSSVCPWVPELSDARFKNAGHGVVLALDGLSDTTEMQSALAASSWLEVISSSSFSRASVGIS